MTEGYDVTHGATALHRVFHPQRGSTKQLRRLDVTKRGRHYGTLSHIDLSQTADASGLLSLATTRSLGISSPPRQTGLEVTTKVGQSTSYG